jgi:hypothetical protein
MSQTIYIFLNHSYNQASYSHNQVSIFYDKEEANKAALDCAINTLAINCLDWLGFDKTTCPSNLQRQIEEVKQKPLAFHELEQWYSRIDRVDDVITWLAGINSYGLFYCDIKVEGYHQDLPASYSLEVFEKLVK